MCSRSCQCLSGTCDCSPSVASPTRFCSWASSDSPGGLLCGLSAGSSLFPSSCKSSKSPTSLNWLPISELYKLYEYKIPSVKTLGTLAKILHMLTYFRVLSKILIRSCLFLLHRNLSNFLIVFLVRVLSIVSRE